MAATVARLQAVLSANTTDFDRGMAKSESRMKSVGKTAGLAGAAVIGGLAVGLKATISAAQDSQKVQVGLESQMKALGITYQDHAKHINEVVNSTSKLAALDDEDLTQSFTRLLPATGNVTKALEEMRLAADIARARNISLESATQLVTKANTGSAGALRRLGITLVKTNTNVTAARDAMAAYKKSHDEISPAMKEHFDDQMKAAKAADLAAQAEANIAKLQTTFKGAAEDYGKTSAAASERFHVALENLEEQIGMKMLPIMATLANRAADFLNWATTNWPRVEQVVTRAFDAIKPSIQNVIDIATMLKDVVEKHWATIQRNMEALKTVVVDALKIVRGAIQLVVDLLHGDWSKAWDDAKAIVSALVDGIKTILVNQAENIKALALALGRAALTGLEEGITGVGAFFLGVIVGLKDMLASQLDDMKAKATNLGKGVLNGIVAGITGVGAAVWGVITGVGTTILGMVDTVKGWGTSVGTWLRTAVIDVVTGLPAAIWAIIAGLPGLLKDHVKDVTEWGAQFAGWLKDAIVDGLSGLGQALVDKIRDEINVLKGPSGYDIAKGIASKIGIGSGGTGPFNASDLIPDGPIGPVGGGDFSISGGGSGPSSLTPSLWDEYNLAKSSIANWQDLGTYNPASLLPSGAPSDHAVFPAKAFDAGFSPATGWNNDSARAFFFSMMNRPGVHYAILGDKIWSRERGLHPYTYGGHDNHVHVSAFDKGGWLQPGLTLAYNGTGRPEAVGGAGGITIHQYVYGSVIQQRETDAFIREAILREKNRGRGI